MKDMLFEMPSSGLIIADALTSLKPLMAADGY